MINTLETNQPIKLYYTSYKAWSGRSFYGTKSGVSAQSVNCDVIVGRMTEKAVQFLSPTKEVWVPKSVMTEISPGVLEVKRGFCYTNGGLSWKDRKPLAEARDEKLTQILK